MTELKLKMIYSHNKNDNEEAKKHIDEVIDKMVVSDETQSKYFRDQSELLEALLKIVPLKD